jgi:hypothetical protein
VRVGLIDIARLLRHDVRQVATSRERGLRCRRLYVSKALTIGLTQLVPVLNTPALRMRPTRSREWLTRCERPQQRSFGDMATWMLWGLADHGKACHTCQSLRHILPDAGNLMIDYYHSYMSYLDY